MMVDEFLLLTPYLAAEVLSLVAYFRVERLLRPAIFDAAVSGPADWTLAKYLNFEIRTQYGIVLANALLLSAMRDLLVWATPEHFEMTTAGSIVMASLSLVFMAFWPLLLRRVWDAVPMPVGPVRTELETLGRRLGFRFSEILIWRTGGGVVNAVVAGVVPWIRYVMLSDGLLDRMKPGEIAAVFGHEVGHVRFRHLLYYVAFAVGSMFLISLSAAPLESRLRPWMNERTGEWVDEVFQYLPLDVWLLFPYFFVVFGWLSRTFERQADLFGARTASAELEEESKRRSAGLEFEGRAEESPWSAATAPPRTDASTSPRTPPVSPEGAAVFIDSLAKVAALNGIPPTARNWRHGSIASRIDFLERVQLDPALADRFDRRVQFLRWGLAAAITVGVFSLWPVDWS
jgi:STE24 endopeptidase